MTRWFEIETSAGLERLADIELPLVIGAGEQAHVRLSSGPAVAAYVGESQKHLFLQAARGESHHLVLHNDEPLDRSVWLKSGDTTRIDEELIQWTLSGQRVGIRIVHVTESSLKPPLIPPTERPVNSSDKQVEPLLVNSATPHAVHRKRQRQFVIGLFVALVLAAAFVLMAKPLEVTTIPEADHLSVSGFPPVIKLGDRYLGFPGRYTLYAEKTGYRPLETDVEINHRGNRYVFTFEKLPGRIDITSDPPGVAVALDDAIVGTTPLQSVDVPLGSHIIGFSHDHYLPVERTVTINESGERQQLHVTLQPAWATVHLRTHPAGARVLVDGLEQGVTPLDVELLAGERQLQFSLAKFRPLTTTLQVTAGEDLTPAVYQLEAAPAHVSVSSEPADATVLVDGVFRGQAPLTVQVAPGSRHEFQIRAAGHVPASRELVLDPEETRSLSVKLAPEYGTVFISAIPPHATLLINGQIQDAANGRFRLPTRPHKLELRADGYQSTTRDFTPQAGYSQRVEIVLVPVAPSGPAAPSRPASRIETGIGQSMVLIEPAAFVMGTSRQEPGRRANEAEHQVLLKRSFYMAEQEVTNREYRLYRQQHVSGMIGNRSLDIDTHPVVNLSWEDAVRFLNWLSKKDGLTPFYRQVDGRFIADPGVGTGYRLPTESEWEYVARLAGRNDRVRYPWAGTFPPQKKVGNFADESARHLLPVVISGYTDGAPATARVGSFQANPVGLYDLGGNVAEWCHDYYAAQVVNPGRVPVDPLGAPSGVHHVVRGSSWRDASITELRFSYRRYSREAADDIGFRIARYAE